MIELRSDTFTRPTADMLAAMASATQGDDVYGEDPTVRELEELAAHTLGKDAGCLMPSGTMANLACLMAHAPRGTKVLVGRESDIYIYEAGGASVCGGLVYEPIDNQPDGTLRIADLVEGCPKDPEDPQFALPAVVCVENTQNRCGGRILSAEHLADVRAFADDRGLRLHLDGARLFNAAAGSGRTPAEIAAPADSVQFCLSKGLSAPIGSMVVGDRELVAKARRIRKMLGGGMRQAGFIAAAGIVAIKTADRLVEDHANARRLAIGLADIPGVEIDPEVVETNICMFRITAPGWTLPAFFAAAREHGLALAELGHGRARAVTHRGVGARDIDDAVDIVAKVLASGKGVA
ncbi:GntG family PLP-dependent aldolase [Actinokineospora globicatena]|uniref:GntG family PLP-dependent aldolase n=1 Tax=Actinokineospora globicatena TaxID=103729 RepID=UPI0020A51595|nr:GntG family PLP-dependent aldolase [Actinokineospora globicatena]MCP2303148.1 L-threonine aldolase [Actinokineospora globicatena]GLW79736.1 threonine aldolase [Actinokineospora globicatena]GLW85854.1 threonine aldolase [Actinokineospora globicatena]